MLRFIPNILTFGRLLLTVIFLIMILYSPRYYAEGELPFPSFLDYAFIIFITAGLTDIIDGKVARMLNVTSRFGRMIDPLADKLLVCGTFICFALLGKPRLFDLSAGWLALIHWSVAAVLVLREAYVTALRHIAEARGINFAATVSGKIKMFLQSFAIGTVVIKMAHVQQAMWGNWFTTIVYAVMLIATVVSGLRATRRTSWRQFKEKHSQTSTAS